MTVKATREATLAAVRAALIATKTQMDAASAAISAENNAELNPLTIEYNKVATGLNGAIAARNVLQAAADAMPDPVVVPPVVVPPVVTPPIDGLIPVYGRSAHSQKTRTGPCDWINPSKVAALVAQTPPWTIYADANQTLAPSQKGVFATAHMKLHLWGISNLLYQGMPRLLDDGTFDQSNPQAGTDDFFALIPKVESYLHPKAGPRGKCLISPYTTWHGHTRIKPDGTLGSSRAPLHVGIRLDRMLQFLFRDGSIRDVIRIPGDGPIPDFSFNPPNRMLAYFADQGDGKPGSGKIIKMDRSQAGSNPEDPSKYIFTDYLTGLTLPTSVRVNKAGQMMFCANGLLYKVVNGAPVQQNCPAMTFWVDYTSTDDWVIMTNQTSVHRVSNADGTVGPELLGDGVAVIPFVQISIDRNGTFGPVDDIYCIRSHGPGNVDAWRIAGDNTVYTYYRIVSSGGGVASVGVTSNCIDVWGHYMWLVDIHPDEALMLTQGFADCFPTLVRPRLPSDPPAPQYLHAAMGRGQMAIKTGTTYEVPFGTRPSYSCIMNEQGWSGLGCNSDILGEMDYRTLANFIQAGMIGSFPRPEFKDGSYDLFCLMYTIYWHSIRCLREGSPLIEGLKAWIGPNWNIPTPAPYNVTNWSPGWQTATFVRVFADRIAFMDDYGNETGPRTIPDTGLVLRVLRDEGMPSETDLGTVQAPWKFPIPAQTGLHGYTVKVVSGGVKEYVCEATVL